MSADGALRFARYAYPPCELGYCGPAAHPELLERVAAGAADGDLVALDRRFEGAWPYLELIAHANGLADPLDARVVEAYWVGNHLLDAVGATALGQHLHDRFGPRVGADVARLTELAPTGACPHHSLHVFGVYPWVGLLREGVVDEPLRILDRCRIRPGRVVAVGADDAEVLSRPLTWDGRRLAFGPPKRERVQRQRDGWSLAGVLAPGDLVAMHWDWVCEQLTPRAAHRLVTTTARQLAALDRVAHPGPAAVC